MSQFSSYHVFATRAGAQAACDAIYQKMVRRRQARRVARGGPDSLPDLANGGVEVDTKTLTAAQINGTRFPILGQKGGQGAELPALGRTTAWDIPRQIPFGPNAGKWIIAVPQTPADKIGQAESTDAPTWWEAVPSPVDPNA